MQRWARAALGMIAAVVLAAAGLSSMAFGQERASPMPTQDKATVLTGIDVLEADGFAQLKGLRIGLLTHRAGRARDGRRSIDVLAAAADVKLVALFSPEHGLGADREGDVAAATEGVTKLPVHSLYGPSKRPTPEMLQGLDAIVIDLQDAGVRFYTYATTMAYLMEAAAKARVKVVVLDRPNPIGGAGVAGPVLDKDLRSFVGYFAMPVQHGMTMGELARLFNEENGLGADLAVVAMRGYARGSWYDETGLTWISPSPNLRRLSGTVLYPGVGILEFANLSVGRGTATPFELVGAPWVDGTTLARVLKRRNIAGVRITVADFMPKASKFAGQRCFGVRLTVENRKAVDAVGLGIEIAAALRQLHPETFEQRELLRLLGSRETLAAIEARKDPAAIIASWRQQLQAFQEKRLKYLLY